MILFQVLRELLDDHKDVVSYLAQGFKECRKHIKVRRSLLLTTGFGTLSLNKWHWFKVPIIINIVGRRASLGVQSGFISVWGSLTGPIDVSWEPGTVNGWLAPFLNLSFEAQILFSPNFCGTRPLPASRRLATASELFKRPFAWLLQLWNEEKFLCRFESDKRSTVCVAKSNAIYSCNEKITRPVELTLNLEF